MNVKFFFSPGSTKTSKFEEGVEILKLQRSVVVSAGH